MITVTNPGTLSAVHTTYNRDGGTLFKYLFFAFRASVAGYKLLRKVIAIDGTSTKGKYKNCLVAASGQDENYQIFPLGFGIIDGENTAGWSWFLNQLKCFVPDEEDLVFVSDRHLAIYAALRDVYPLAKHGACSVHLCRNVKSIFKIEGLASIVSKASRAYTVGDFKYWFNEIQGVPNVQNTLKRLDSLTDIGLLSRKMSSNIFESLNAAMKKAMDYPIVTMVKFIRSMFMRWFCERRDIVKKTRTRCTPEIEDILIANLQNATDCAVISASEHIAQVNNARGFIFTVDLDKKTCTCRVFDVLLVPCCHALAALVDKGVDMYTVVGKTFFVEQWLELWKGLVLPPPREADIDIPEEVADVNMIPPKTKRGPRRPQSIRWRSAGEDKGAKASKQRKCTTCGLPGHNRGTCKNPI